MLRAGEAYCDRLTWTRWNGVVHLKSPWSLILIVTHPRTSDKKYSHGRVGPAPCSEVSYLAKNSSRLIILKPLSHRVNMKYKPIVLMSLSRLEWLILWYLPEWSTWHFPPQYSNEHSSEQGHCQPSKVSDVFSRSVHSTRSARFSHRRIDAIDRALSTSCVLYYLCYPYFVLTLGPL